jgi:hypothetical protein
MVFFGPMDQKLWVFEVSRRSLGRAGMCWSQPARVDHLHKKWRAGRKNISRKTGNCTTGAGVDPRPVGDRWSLAGPGPPTCGRRSLVADISATSGRLPAAGRHLHLWDSLNFFEIFLFKKKEFLEVWVMGQGF